MAHLDLKTEYVLSLTAQEFRLVGLALSGRLKNDEDVLAAKEMNHRLLEMSLAHGAKRQEVHGKALELAKGQ